jgi:hypothetical protein
MIRRTRRRAGKTPRSLSMETQREGELYCKRKCDADLTECEAGSIYTEECSGRWDYCMDECLSACEIF